MNAEFISKMRNRIGDDVMNLLVKKYVGTKWTILFEIHKEDINKVMKHLSRSQIYIEINYDIIRGIYLSKKNMMAHENRENKINLRDANEMIDYLHDFYFLSSNFSFWDEYINNIFSNE